MSVWVQSKASFWFAGVQFSDFWLEDASASSRRICYQDPALGWAIVPCAQFGRTVSLDGSTMAMQPSEVYGMPWFRGGGFDLFRGEDGWYLVPTLPGTHPAKPLHTPRWSVDAYGDYNGEDYYEVWGFSFWSDGDYTCYYCDPAAGVANKTVAVSAQNVVQHQGNGARPFSSYKDGTWIGLPSWGGTALSPRIFLCGETWHGCEESNGVLTLVEDGVTYAAPVPSIESDATFSPVDGEGESLDLEWEGYGRVSASQPAWGRIIAIGEASVWR